MFDFGDWLGAGWDVCLHRLVRHFAIALIDARPQLTLGIWTSMSTKTYFINKFAINIGFSILGVSFRVINRSLFHIGVIILSLLSWVNHFVLV